LAASDDKLGLSTAQNGLKIGLNFQKIVIVGIAICLCVFSCQNGKLFGNGFDFCVCEG
jgi:hypothetical protein